MAGKTVQKNKQQKELENLTIWEASPHGNIWMILLAKNEMSSVAVFLGTVVCMSLGRIIILVTHHNMLQWANIWFFPDKMAAEEFLS
jgi:hypothetical protein